MKYLVKVKSKRRVNRTKLVANCEVEAPDEKTAIAEAIRYFAETFTVSEKIAVVEKLEVI